MACRLLQALEEQDISFEHMPSGIDTMCVVVHESTLEGRKARAAHSRALFAGHGGDPFRSGADCDGGSRHGALKGISARLFNALMKAGCERAADRSGSSELNIIVGVDNLDFEVATRAIYRAFVTKDNRW